MNIYSPAFEDYQVMPAAHTADGENVSPVLMISDVPEGSKELVLVVHDVDSVGGGDWLHWMVLSIDPKASQIDGVPKGAREIMNDFGQTHYGGPDPVAGSGNHRYSFDLYALDTVLSAELLDRSSIETAMRGHTIAQAVWVGTYQRT